MQARSRPIANLSVEDLTWTGQTCQCIYQFSRKNKKYKSEEKIMTIILVIVELLYIMSQIYDNINYKMYYDVYSISIHRQSSNTLERLFDLRN